MKSPLLLAALNAVYFGVAAASAAWCVHTYGLSTPASYMAGATLCVYAFLAAASLVTLIPRRPGPAKPAASLQPHTKVLIRAAFLILPIAYFAYIASFYFVERTYRTIGGVDRYEAFSALELSLFGKEVCTPFRPYSASCNTYFTVTFADWVKHQWHAQETKNPYKLVCRFDVSKDGTIKNLKVHKSSGDKNCDRAALAALDSVAPPLPPDAPDRMLIEYTFGFSGVEDKWPVFETETITPAQDKFLFEQGDRANFHCDYPRSRKLLLQCLEERRLRFKSGAPELTEILVAVAKLYCRMGLIPESEKYFEEALTNAQFEQKQHPEAVITTLQEYANQSFECKKFDKALNLYKKYFSLAPSSADRSSQIRLAESYYGTGARYIAAKVFADVIRSDEQQGSTVDAHTLESERVSLCNQYVKSGHADAAIKLMDEYFAQYTEERDPKLKKEKFDLICALHETYRQAAPSSAKAKLYTETVFTELLRINHPLSEGGKWVRSDLASTLLKSGDKAGALALYQNLVAKYSANTTDRAYALMQQASFLFKTRDYSESERCVREVLSIRSRSYAHDDARVTNAKFALAAILTAQHREEEAAHLIDQIAIPTDPRSGNIWRLSSFYEQTGQLERALQIVDGAIRRSYKSLPQNEIAIRSNLIDRALDFSEKLHDEKRFEKYLNEQYQTEIKCSGLENRFPLVKYYLEHNQLATAEKLANLQVKYTHPKSTDIFEHEAQATAFILLAHVKDAQKRRESAKYYVERAIEAVETYGRSSEHVTAVGLLAQLRAREGDLKSAEDLLNSLYKNELTDTSQAVCGDIVSGFNTTGCYFSSGSSGQTEYTESGGSRSDSEIYGDSADKFEPTPTPVPMVSLNWNAAVSQYHEFQFLQASTLEALARIQTLESKPEAAAKSRALLFDLVEAHLGRHLASIHGINLCDMEGLARELPKSERQQKLLVRARETSKQPIEWL
ncbi:MAG: TonB family protein [Candidatus Melainabacteria bacterium]|nr:MAG: TonB family protein [Candidatus Melainabacteria bacterium]